MKNSLKLSLLALVFAVGIGGAVVQKVHAAPKLDDPKYNWTQSGGSSLNDATVQDAKDFYGCPSDGVGCADGKLTTNPNVIVHIKQ